MSTVPAPTNAPPAIAIGQGFQDLDLVGGNVIQGPVTDQARMSPASSRRSGT
jgi:hypothetical protein